MAVIYGILYLAFVGWPIVFTGYRGFSTSVTGLAFIGLAVGCLLVIGLEPLIRRMINAHKKDPETGKIPIEAMVSVICIGAVLAPVGQLWFAWTCIPPVHWIWPMSSGIPVSNVSSNMRSMNIHVSCCGQADTLYACSLEQGIRSCLFMHPTTYPKAMAVSPIFLRSIALGFSDVRSPCSLCRLSNGRKFCYTIHSGRYSSASRTVHVCNLRSSLGWHFTRSPANRDHPNPSPILQVRT